MSLSKVLHYYELYKENIVCNPNLASEIEFGIKCISYLASGRFINSNLVSELFFSSSQILTLINDSFLKKALNLYQSINPIIVRLQSLINLIEYIQVFCEYSGQKFGNEKGKWIAICVIQFVKSMIKLLLLLKYKQGLQKRFPIFSLDRKKIAIDFVNNGKLNNNPLNTSKKVYNYYNSINIKKCNVLESGRIIRKLEYSQKNRDWTLPKNTSLYKHLIETRINIPPTKLNDIQILSECVYIIKPLVHLALMGYFGQKFWTPFFISLFMDAFNILVLNSTKERLNRSEVNEFYSRTFNLSFYLLKSPMFDNYTKSLIIDRLRNVTAKIPIFRVLMLNFIDYLPEWQKTYFHLN